MSLVLGAHHTARTRVELFETLLLAVFFTGPLKSWSYADTQAAWFGTLSDAPSRVAFARSLPASRAPAAVPTTLHQA
jgi:hypothetical protein